MLFVPEGNFCPLRHVLTFWILIFPHARTVPRLSETFLKVNMLAVILILGLLLDGFAMLFEKRK